MLNLPPLIIIEEQSHDPIKISAFDLTVYKKHYPPSLTDEVWRLEKIGKDGSFHKKLNKAGIYSVEDFLRLVVRDSKKLRSVRFISLLALPTILLATLFSSAS